MNVSPKRNKRARPPSVLTIAGSDSGGGAGIQADLKTFAAHGIHGVCAITAVTAQHTRGVTDIHVLPLKTIERQIEAAFDDFDIRAVKIGMLGSRTVVQLVNRVLRRYVEPGRAGQTALPVVLDPVMVATSGDRLLDERAIRSLLDLFGIAAFVTPNIPEAEALIRQCNPPWKVTSPEKMRDAAGLFRCLGVGASLIKGGHLPGRTVVDVYEHHPRVVEFEHPRLKIQAHGTGCTLASALAARLAQRASYETAARDAVEYVNGALRHAFHPGRGAAVLDHFWRGQPGRRARTLGGRN